MKEEKVFEEGWKEALDSFHTTEQMEEIKKIFWRNLTKLFKGRIEVLPTDKETEMVDLYDGIHKVSGYAKLED